MIDLSLIVYTCQRLIDLSLIAGTRELRGKLDGGGRRPGSGSVDSKRGRLSSIRRTQSDAGDGDDFGDGADDDGGWDGGGGRRRLGGGFQIRRTAQTHKLVRPGAAPAAGRWEGTGRRLGDGTGTGNTSGRSTSMSSSVDELSMWAGR